MKVFVYVKNAFAFIGLLCVVVVVFVAVFCNRKRRDITGVSADIDGATDGAEGVAASAGKFARRIRDSEAAEGRAGAALDRAATEVERLIQRIRAER